MSDAAQRRNSPRQRFSCRARFHNPYAFDAESERLCVTRDFSCDGLYFIADDNGLRKNMRLLMRFPNSLPAVQDHEYLVEVTRMHALPENHCGVGARLILRAAVGRCRDLIAPKTDLSIYAYVQRTSRQLVDLYA